MEDNIDFAIDMISGGHTLHDYLVDFCPDLSLMIKASSIFV